MNKQLNGKKIDIFIKIVEYYIKFGNPVASKTLVETFNLNVSAATVRNIMRELEDVGFIEKSHISSGRVPTKTGLEYYARNLAYFNNTDLKVRLEKIFLQRNLSIDQVIELAAQTISEVIGVTLITSEANSKELLTSLQLVKLNELQATVIVVLSNGRVSNKMVDITKYQDIININDLVIAIRLFNERLRNMPMSEIRERAMALLPILANSIHNYEQVMQVLLRKVFGKEEIYTNRVYGKENIIKSPNIDRENLVRLLNTIEHQSVWDLLDNGNDDENIKIDIQNNNTTFLTKRIELERNRHKELIVVGDDKIDFAKTKSALLMLDEFITKQNNNQLIVKEQDSEEDEDE